MLKSKYFYYKILTAFFTLGLLLVYLTMEVAFRLVTWSPKRTTPFQFANIDTTSKTNVEWMAYTRDPLSDFQVPFEKVSFVTSDQLELKGWFVEALNKKNDCAISLVHGRGSDRRTFLKHLKYIRKTNCALLFFDLLNHGESPSYGYGTSLGYFESRDAIASVDFLKTQKHFKKIHLLGTSLGGAASIIAAAQDSRIDSIIVENTFSSPLQVLKDFGGPSVKKLDFLQRADFFLEILLHFSEFRLGIKSFLNNEELVGKISPRPTLFVHSKEDTEIPYAHTLRLFEAAKEPKRLLLTEKGNHSAVYNTNPDEYEKEVLDFLK